jgi:uncharacterized membrane protein YkvA (DUF1232 family)
LLSRFLTILPTWGKLRAFWAMVRDPKAAWGSKLIALVALVYLVFPADILPDMLPLVGWLDDAGVIGLAVAKLTADLKKYQRE